MTQRMYFEGLTLTVESVDRAIEFYSGKLGTFKQTTLKSHRIYHKAAARLALR